MFRCNTIQTKQTKNKNDTDKIINKISKIEFKRNEAWTKNNIFSFNIGSTSTELYTPLNSGSTSTELYTPLNIGSTSTELYTPLNIGSTSTELYTPTA